MLFYFIPPFPFPNFPLPPRVLTFLTFHTSQYASENAQLAIQAPYKCMHSSSLLDLKKTTEVVEGLS